MIIDGKEMARKEYDKLKEEIASLSKKLNLTAVLV
jgi:5,10-methylene-tetrahydrofolate dehydrogenase/methenyl tetrahydrofolate cyclohydrolase